MANIHDVARLAGVSIKTVSRVTNGEASVREATREKVLRAAKELNYLPHRGARMMRGRGSELIGMITGAVSASGAPPSASGLSAIHIVRGVLQACRKAGKTLMIADATGDWNEVGQLLGIFEAHSVEGVVIASDFHRQVVLPLPASVPVVLANCFDAAGTPAVVPDDYQGQYSATKFLIESGHARLGMLGLEDGLLASHLRRQGFFDACREYGLPVSKLRFQSGYTQEGGKTPIGFLADALKRIIQGDDAPTAVMFGNDLMTLKAIPYLKAAGLDVPSDLSLVGFDNDERICETIQPTLTTVQLPYDAIGAIAAERLFAMLKGEFNESNVSKVPCEIVRRESTCAIGARTAYASSAAQLIE